MSEFFEFFIDFFFYFCYYYNERRKFMSVDFAFGMIVGALLTTFIRILFVGG